MTWHPALPLLMAAALQGFVRERARGAVAFAGALGALAAVAALPAGAEQRVTLLGAELVLVRVDALARVFATVFAVMACLGTLYALHLRRASEHAATLAYAGAALGVVLAGDWLTLLLFWEGMAVSSALVVWHGDQPGTRAAGFRYLLVHLASGALVLAGVLLLYQDGVHGVAAVPEGAARWLLLAGVAVNAAVPPLHAWLTDSYPEASVTGSVFLSAFTTKSAVYVLVRGFPGLEPLVWLGTAMALYGVVYAVLENDIRRLLAYHVVSQVGYMVAGVGMGTALSLDGAAAHAFCHILYKGLLFMGAGAVLAATGRRKLTELGGIGPRMKAVMVLYMVGAFSISGVPLFNGFVSKSMIVSAAAESGRPVVELLLVLASIGTFLHTGLKLPYFTFFGASARVDVRPLPHNMLAAMALAAFLCAGLGLAPGWLYARLPLEAVYRPYTVDHVVAALQLLIGTGAAFALLLPKLAGEPTVSLDADWLYRRPLRRALGLAVRASERGGRRAEQAASVSLGALAALAEDPSRAFRRLRRALDGKAPQGPAGGSFDPDLRRQPVGTVVLWVTAALGLAALVLG